MTELFFPTDSVSDNKAMDDGNSGHSSSIVPAEGDGNIFYKIITETLLTKQMYDFNYVTRFLFKIALPGL